jgi:hypothetical protein
MKLRLWSNVFLVVAGVAAGLAIAWVDSRPSWDDTGISAAAIFLAAFILGALSSNQAWMSALAVGVWIPLLGIIRSRNYASGLALAFAFAGAYAGWAVRKLLGKLASPVAS